MNVQESFKEIFIIMKASQKEIKKLRNNKSINNPIQIDLVKTRKSMSYEEILEILKQFSKNQRNNND